MQASSPARMGREGGGGLGDEGPDCPGDTEALFRRHELHGGGGGDGTAAEGMKCAA